MDKELKAKWVEALRSGKFKQATGVLKSDGGYCCLGVLREVATPGNEREDHDEFILHEDDANAFGLTRPQQKQLANLNDGRAAFGVKPEIRRHTFAEIADYIEEKF